MVPNESPYMVSYMSTIEMKSLFLVVFEIYAKITFYPLDSGPKSKVMTPKPIYGFLYVYNRNEVSISPLFRDICENSILTS